MNPMMNMGGGMPMQMGFSGGTPPWANMGMNMNMNMWQQQQQSPGAMQMLSPGQFMVPPPTDPNYFAAHQQAMMYAKQAYQIAVAQQAMAAAADEWERGSTVGGLGGGSVYGGSTAGSSYGMGMGGVNMMGMQGMGNGWSTGSTLFPPSTRSMYGGGLGGGMSSSRSEYGGGGGRGGGGNWSSSKSSYGESFGPEQSNSRKSGIQRESGYFPPVPLISQEALTQGRGSPRSRTASQPASPARAGVRRAPPPPSSWKAGV